MLVKENMTPPPIQPLLLEGQVVPSDMLCSLTMIGQRRMVVRPLRSDITSIVGYFQNVLGTDIIIQALAAPKGW